MAAKRSLARVAGLDVDLLSRLESNNFRTCEDVLTRHPFDLVELLDVEAVKSTTSSKTNYVIGYIDSGHGNVRKAGNRLVDPDYFMSLLPPDAIERATAAGAT